MSLHHSINIEDLFKSYSFRISSSILYITSIFSTTGLPNEHTFVVIHKFILS